MTVDLILTPTELNAGENDFFVQNALKNWLETNKEEPCTTCETELTEEEIIELKDDDENF